MPKDTLVAQTRKVAAQVAHGPTAAFMQSKRLVRRIDEEAMGLFAVLKCEAQAQGAAGKDGGLQGRHHGVSTKARAEVRQGK